MLFQEFIFRYVCLRALKHLHTLRWRHNECDSVSNHQPHDCLLNRVFRRRSKKTSKLCVTGLCAGKSPGTGEFPAQMATNAENVSMWWRHHDPCQRNELLVIACLKCSITICLTQFRWEMCIFLFWVVCCGIWDKCIQGVVKLVYSIRYHTFDYTISCGITRLRLYCEYSSQRMKYCLLFKRYYTMIFNHQSKTYAEHERIYCCATTRDTLLLRARAMK